MGLDPVTLGYIAVAVTGTATVAQGVQQHEAAVAGRDAQKEQMALNASRAAQERRQQIREERVRRARVLQASENTGTTESSGQMGAVGNLATQLQTNIGFNLAQIRGAERISGFQQEAQDAMDEANMWRQVQQLGGSIFQAAGGFGSTAGTGSASTAPANISRGGGFSPST